uniref:GNAT family acetyltransferase n=1 Tax=uncultured marine crenarchaeote E37-7F TaxID=907717 RepID=G9BAR4_9ARCH|nr:GNAT family acetyltransferase [uncultured marine crenarchaeote E37-7F]
MTKWITLLLVSLLYGIRELTPSFESLFYNHVAKDVPHYFLFIYDWKYERKNTKIWLAVEHDEIYGMMLIYKNRIVQLRGNEPIIEAFLDMIDLKMFQLHAESQYRDFILRKCHMKKEYVLQLMIVRKGEEHLSSSDIVTKLTPEWADEIAYLMRTANPEFWDDRKKETIVSSMNRRLWMGIIMNGNTLVSVGSTHLTDFGSNIGSLATHESYLNRGYATAVASALVKEILHKNDFALVFVRKNNLPALGVYEKLGFKQYRNYLYGYAEI